MASLYLATDSSQFDPMSINRKKVESRIKRSLKKNEDVNFRINYGKGVHGFELFFDEDLMNHSERLENLNLMLKTAQDVMRLKRQKVELLIYHDKNLTEPMTRESFDKMRQELISVNTET